MNRETWDQLLNFESRELVARNLAKRYPDWKLVRTKEVSAEVCAAFRQARSYFESASEANAAIKPLLMYYGVLGLTRGLVMFTGQKLREANLDPRHGLTAKGWANALGVNGTGIEALSVSLDNCGTFRELVEAVSNRTLVRFNSSAIQWDCLHRSLEPKPIIISFVDLIRRTPAVSTFANLWLQLPCCFVAIHSVNDGASWNLKIHCSEQDRERLQVICGTTSFSVIAGDSNYIDVQLKPTDTSPYIWSDVPLSYQRGGAFGIGSAFLIEPFGETQLCQISALFIMSYVLGMLARYHPSHWTALIGNEKYDAALPTVQALISHIEERFPSMVIEFLENKMIGART